MEIELDRLRELSQVASIEKICAKGNYQRLESEVLLLIQKINDELARLEQPKNDITVIRLDSSCIDDDGAVEPYTYTENEFKVRIRNLKSKRRKLKSEIKLLKRAYSEQDAEIWEKECEYIAQANQIRRAIESLMSANGKNGNSYSAGGYRKERAILARIVEKIQAAFR